MIQQSANDRVAVSHQTCGLVQRFFSALFTAYDREQSGVDSHNQMNLTSIEIEEAPAASSKLLVVVL